jgi:uncharacterized protein
MPILDPSVWALIAFAALLAGFMDSAVGGGGMVLVPTLFTALPNVLPATILGTNKISGIGGTGMASLATRIAQRTSGIVCSGAGGVLGEFDTRGFV